MQLHIGLSAYDNPGWIGGFYPYDMERKDWFAHYCRYFDTYEINGTFYRFPTVKSLKNWYYKSPDGFRFSVKAPKSITHLSKFSDTRAEVEKFYAVCREALSAKLSFVLFQLPPAFSYDAKRLDDIVSQLDPEFRNAIEFRNQSWWRQDVFDALAMRGISFCNVSYPNLPDAVVPSSDLYIRMHGDPKLFYSEYGPERVFALSEKIREVNPENAYVYFNNTITPAAVNDALILKSLF